MSNNIIKMLRELGPNDFIDFPIWKFDRQAAWDEPLLTPDPFLPVTELSNRLVGTKVRLNNGNERWAMLSNMHLNDIRSTSHFLTLSIEQQGNWFDLARYHDVDYLRRGPTQLAAFLHLQISDVFPIAYDISNYAIGLPSVVRGVINTDPSERLSQAELNELALK